LGNALKFTEKGAITLSCKLARQVSATKAVLEFAVKDTGIGIPPDKLEHIFDAFAQAEADTHVRFGGTGLGLSICKQLIEIQGGTLGVESTVGKGSIFRFSLPVDMAPSPAPAEPAPSAAAKLSRKQILLVEDNQFNRMLAVELLDKIIDEPGITLAENGAEAVEKTLENTFDLILMDIRMPVMDGIDAAKAIRKNGLQTPIVALTANATTEEEQRCGEAGMNDYLSKPIDLELLRDKIDRWTNRK
ncbi:MAG TPA: response regulator, partial [Saprospiraceae bacterium]|nr:response regulator [Saprospiraceae bacterium]